MKTAMKVISLVSFVLALLATAVAQQADAPEKKAPAEAKPADAKPAETVPPEAKPAEGAPPAAQSAAEPSTTQPAAPPATETPAAEPAKPPVADGEKGLRLNFRGVPLEMVLNYLSDAAGFIIVSKTDVKGKVDVWSNQPLTKDEAVDLLNTVLNQNGYAAVRNGRTLKIVSREDAKKQDIPVESGNDPDGIPKSDEIVTQIIPVRYANATQLTKDLLPLMPTDANMTANESANALVITDTQANIRRMTEIVKALDTSISSISAIRVFPLRFADAKELATAVKELFQPPTTTQQGGGGRQQFLNRFLGGGGPGGGGPGGGGGGGTGASAAMSGASRVVAVADERTNSLVVSAPEDAMPTIEGLVREIDVSATDVTELRVFHLVNADPMELADIFAELFPDETTTRSSGGGGPGQGFQFNRGPGGGGNRAAQTSTSDRLKKKGRVLAVADQRTSSLIVSAASELMPQIGEMIAQLDASPAKKQKVFVYSLENADPLEVEQIIRDMFQRTTTQGSRNTANQGSALSNRQQNQGQGGQGNTGFGNTGFGNTRGAGQGGGRTFP